MSASASSGADDARLSMGASSPGASVLSELNDEASSELDESSFKKQKTDEDDDDDDEDFEFKEMHDSQKDEEKEFDPFASASPSPVPPQADELRQEEECDNSATTPEGGRVQGAAVMFAPHLVVDEALDAASEEQGVDLLVGALGAVDDAKPLLEELYKRAKRARALSSDSLPAQTPISYGRLEILYHDDAFECKKSCDWHNASGRVVFGSRAPSNCHFPHGCEVFSNRKRVPGDAKSSPQFYVETSKRIVLEAKLTLDANAPRALCEKLKREELQFVVELLVSDLLDNDARLYNGPDLYSFSNNGKLEDLCSILEGGKRLQSGERTGIGPTELMNSNGTVRFDTKIADGAYSTKTTEQVGGPNKMFVLKVSCVDPKWGNQPLFYDTTPPFVSRSRTKIAHGKRRSE